ncbi:hypothetical protein GF362_00650 [Candidatus Dojkabacteria bacterium]|nr:hypothetical protein [Candidatus Dojkabacteria bacterium]
MKIFSETFVDSNIETIIDYFYKVSTNPDIYKMDSHKGIIPVKGKIIEEGAIFETREKFLLIFLRLRFITTKTKANKSFTFKLIKPFSYLNIMGKFVLQQNKEKVSLKLVVFNDPNSHFLSKMVSTLIFYSPIRFLIKKQISKEVQMIENSIEESILVN